MTFREVPAVVGASPTRRVETVTVAMNQMLSKTRLRIVITADLAERMGARDGDRLKIAFGERENFGRLRLWKAMPGFALRATTSDGNLLAIGTTQLPTAFHTEPHSPDVVAHDFPEPGVLEVKLPRWLVPELRADALRQASQHLEAD